MSLPVYCPFRIFVIVLVFLAFSSYGFAATNTPSQDQKPTEKKEDTKETPEKFFGLGMEELSGRAFMTSDGILLSGSFYPGNADKDTVPVLLLHGQGKSREEFTPLIEEMKKRGYAILAFDFRGHGESITRFTQANSSQERRMPNPNWSDGAMPPPQMPPQPPKPVEYLQENFKREDYENLYKFDCLPFYRFLVQKNNEEKLNLNKLVIIGTDMGGTVGGQMTKQLWANSKGKNVRALIIVSPNYDPFSKTLLTNAKCFHKDVPLLMMIGQLDKRARDNALNLREDILGKERRKDDDPTSMSSPIPIAEFPTERQKGELLKESKLGIPQRITDYIDVTLAKHKEKDLKWRKM